MFAFGHLCQRDKRSGDKPHAQAGSRDNRGRESCRIVIVASVRVLFIAIPVVVLVVDVFYLRGGCNVRRLNLGLCMDISSACRAA